MEDTQPIEATRREQSTAEQSPSPTRPNRSRSRARATQPTAPTTPALDDIAADTPSAATTPAPATSTRSASSRSRGRSRSRSTKAATPVDVTDDNALATILLVTSTEPVVPPIPSLTEDPLLEGLRAEPPASPLAHTILDDALPAAQESDALMADEITPHDGDIDDEGSAFDDDDAASTATSPARRRRRGRRGGRGRARNGDASSELAELADADEDTRYSVAPPTLLMPTPAAASTDAPPWETNEREEVSATPNADVVSDGEQASGETSGLTSSSQFIVGADATPIIRDRSSRFTWLKPRAARESTPTTPAPRAPALIPPTLAAEWPVPPVPSSTVPTPSLPTPAATLPTHIVPSPSAPMPAAQPPVDRAPKDKTRRPPQWRNVPAVPAPVVAAAVPSPALAFITTPPPVAEPTITATQSDGADRAMERNMAMLITLFERQTRLLEALAGNVHTLRQTLDEMATAQRRTQSVNRVAPRTGIFVDTASIYYATDVAKVGLDFARMVASISTGRDVVHTVAYAPISDEGLGTRYETQRFAAPFARSGFKIVARPLRRFPDGTGKGNFDIDMTVDILGMAERLDVIVLVTGNGDFSRLIETVQRRGVRVEVVAFANQVSHDLRYTPDAFIDISAHMAEFGIV